MAESSKLSSRFAQVLYDVFFKSSILWSRLRIKKSYGFLPSELNISAIRL
jgi:hypothetical protein